MTPQFLEGNRLTLLRSGAEYFPALEAAIRAARHAVHLETYIYMEDETGLRITEALCEAARRGVAVHVLVDGFGAKDMPEALKARLREAGVQLLIYRQQISPFALQRQRLRRMHRKAAAIDGRVAFIGGINIIDDMHTPGHTPPRYDYAVRIEGPLLLPVQRLVEHLWRLITWARFKRRRRLERRLPVADSPIGNQRAALVVRDNLRHRSDIENAYLEAIESAREEIILANAYFFPGKRFRHALMGAARRGVRVILLLQGRVEYVLLHYASRALYGTLLDAGVQIHEYHKSFLHAKVAVIDGLWATVGSSNIDPFSLLLAREANVVVEDRRFAAELRASLREAMKDGAHVIERMSWRRKPLGRRMMIWIAYAFTRFLMGMAGYGGQH
ncbi:MAG: cardiolipin synthase ClsB [Betaproteobacteria bacterium]|nr:cardiolipin synthase ClsB [Betaproteobacteria bacterium]